MYGDAFSIKAPKEYSKKFVATFQEKFLSRGNVLRMFFLFLEDFGAPLSKRCRHSGYSEICFAKLGALSGSSSLLSWPQKELSGTPLMVHAGNCWQVFAACTVCVCVCSEGKICTKGVFSSENTFASTGKKQVWCVPKSLFSREKEGQRRRTHIHQRGFQVFAGDERDWHEF